MANIENDLKSKNVLVTGGAGFIGSNLCDKLISLGAAVICLDNFFTGKKDNISHLIGQENFVLKEGDVNQPEFLEKIFDEYNIDYVFHYAAVLGVKRVTENPLLVLPDLDGIRHLLRIAQAKKVKKIVFASSSEAYGFSTALPLKEDDGQELIANQSNHAHLYALIKLIGEKIMKTYNDHYGLPTVSLRFFNVFGPRQESSAYGFVVGVFIKQILDGQPPTIYGDGYQTRDFIYIDDNVRLAIQALLEEKTNGEVINIGVGRQTTIVDLAERLLRLSGQDLRPVFIKDRSYEIKYRSPDVTKMRRLLGDGIADNLDDNLKKTYEWYRKNMFKQKA
ncbi:LPS biosynthesis protein WbpP [Candidatus Falkowbacteria bacterium CG_4_10_14_0_2_um_filter_48_10]|uniref:LPS biosynthesis protein WbpP n=1 Tax=Candidatus Falkowbacteria bacterium CG23_combo_of_CG06-09_8_20_14_all_49_15 TaxID=1974572 RepID=A0A2G9ZMQ6_9BACT|nr:MAG: LPS biosynthesis protein WbpP [Candidatus Falkowbacteria bacterium CG23_combo_of_CG06-09_8_20_14_all_49_15]PJA08600.1 MAG: LPS biosynthesis protein WbpP [Candidatus Falkowbacteria bacterium CG_4_10_14_0_2_um_filter_48_10]